MHSQAEHSYGERQANARRSLRLLPSLGILALAELLTLLLRQWPVLAAAGIFLVTGYLGYLILVTRDSLEYAHHLHPVDRALCRWSGPLAVLIAVLLVLLVDTVASNQPVRENWIGSQEGLFAVKLTMEVGLILSVACWCAPQQLRHVPPVTLWRVLVVPLVLIYGAYIVLIPVAQCVGDCDQDRPRVVAQYGEQEP